MQKKTNLRLILLFLPVLCTVFYIALAAHKAPSSLVPANTPAKACCNKNKPACTEKPEVSGIGGSQFFTGA